MCVLVSMYINVFVCQKNKKIRGGPMPYLVEPLKHWMSRLCKRQSGFPKLIMCGLMLVLCHMEALWVLVSFCKRHLKQSVVIHERLCVTTDLRSNYPQSLPIHLKDSLSDLGSGRGSIWDESFAAIQAFLHAIENLKSSGLCFVCV